MKYKVRIIVEDEWAASPDGGTLAEARQSAEEMASDIQRDYMCSARVAFVIEDEEGEDGA